MGRRRATIQKVTLDNTVARWPGTGPRPLEFVTQGQQTLFRDCVTVTPGTFSYVTKYHTPGPNVFLRVKAAPGSPAQPHMQWATGLLIDSATGAAPSFINRADSGSGHGWAVGYRYGSSLSSSSFRMSKDTKCMFLQVFSTINYCWSDAFTSGPAVGATRIHLSPCSTVGHKTAR